MVNEKKLLIQAIAVSYICVATWIGAIAQQHSQAEIKKYTMAAENAMAAKNLPAALSALEKLSNLTPDVAQVHANLGLVLYMQGRYTQAIGAFQRAARLDPRLPNVYTMLGLCFAETGRNQEAAQLLAPAFASSANQPMRKVIGLDLLRAYRALRDYRHADDLAAELQHLYPDDAEVLYNSSRLYGDQSLELMIRLMKAAPNSPWVLLAFAQVNEAQKRYDSAITQYRRVLKIEPQLPGVHLSLGRAILLNSNTPQAADAALREFESELQIDPGNAQAEYEIGEVYRKRGQINESLKHYLRATELQPDFEQAQIALARVLVNLHEPKQAIPHLVSAIRLNPANEVSHFLLATAYGETGQAAGHAREMALYRRYHIRPYAGSGASRFEVPPGLTSTEVTPQTLGPQAQR